MILNLLAITFFVKPDKHLYKKGTLLYFGPAPVINVKPRPRLCPNLQKKRLELSSTLGDYNIFNRQCKKRNEHPNDLCANPEKCAKSSKAMESIGAVETVLSIWKNVPNTYCCAIQGLQERIFPSFPTKFLSTPRLSSS
jgi:hypothetical protein